MILLSGLFSACSPTFNRSAYYKKLAAGAGASADTANTMFLLLDNQQGSSLAVVSTTSFNLSRISVGGNKNRVTGTGGNFVLKGGVVGNLSPQ